MTRETDYFMLAESFEENGKYQKAERLYKKALGLKLKIVDPSSPELVPYLYSLGMIQAALDKTRDAYATLGRAIAILSRQHDEDHEEIKEIRAVLASLGSDSHELAVNA